MFSGSKPGDSPRRGLDGVKGHTFDSSQTGTECKKVVAIGWLSSSWLLLYPAAGRLPFRWLRGACE